MDYHSYPYTPKLLSCFNLIGVATHCEAEYSVSRFFYETALKIAKENGEKFYYAFEYNNIALTYIEEQNYTEAMKNIELAEKVLKNCDEEMGAYIYINKSISLQKLNRLAEASQAFDLAVKEYHAEEIILDDVIRCATTLYYRLGQVQEYEKYKKQILAKMSDMYAAEFMDVCKELFECGMDSDNDELMNTILHSMNQYMKKYPDEIKVGLVFSELEYVYAAKKMDKDAILSALEKKNDYKDRIIAYSMKKRVKSFPEAKKYRFGGDEFVILSFDKNKTIFDEKLEKLTGLWKDNRYSASIGSVWMEHAINFEKSVAVADEMMYTDKSRYYENQMHNRRSRTHVDTEESLKKVEAVADLLPGGFFVYHADEEEQLIMFNQEILKIFKCQNQEEFIELTGNSFRGMVHPDDLKIVESDISSQIVQEKDIDRVQYRIRCKDGTIKTVLDYGRFVHTEKYGDVYYVFLNDVSIND